MSATSRHSPPASARARVGIIGDYDPTRDSHIATQQALEHAAEAIGTRIEIVWLSTSTLANAISTSGLLSTFDGVWCAPGSPYQSLDGALAAIRIAREVDIPLLATCGGFQHVVLEYARNVLGLQDAQHGEYAPEAPDPFVAPLACSLAGRAMRVYFVPNSNAHAIHGRTEVTEEYRCSFGVSRERQHLLDQGGLLAVGFDDHGDTRVVTVPSHRFYVATLYLPQLSSRPGHPHPLVTAFLQEASRP